MKKRILFSIFAMCFFFFSGKAQQQEMYTFCIGNNYAYLLDTAATSTSSYYKRWTLGSSTSYAAYFQKDTVFQSLTSQSGSIGQGGVTGRIKKFAWDGTTVWDYSITSSTTQMHHDLCPMPNGDVLFIVYESKTAAEATQAGCSTSTIIWSEKIVQVHPTGSTTGTVVWEWKLWDHLCQNYNSSKDNYVNSIPNNPQLMNINYETQQDWWHMNGIDYNPELDQILVSSHYMNEVYVIDHSTTTAAAATHTGGKSGKGGDFLYRWGNPAAYGCTAGGNNSNFHVIHDAHWVPATNPKWANWMCVYSNQNSMEGGSGTVEVALWEPPYDTINGYVTYSYTPGSIIGPTAYSKPTIPSITASDLGNSQQLDNGNILVTKPTIMGGSGSFYEVNGSGTTYQSVTVGTNHAYRFKKCQVLGPFPTASTSVSEICENDSFTLNSSATAPAQTSPLYTYSWASTPSGFTSALQNPTVTPTAAGTYTYIVTVSSGGCFNTASVDVVVDACAEIEEVTIGKNELNIFPNPTTGMINLNEEFTLNNNFEISVYNSYGEIIIKENNSKKVDLSTFTNGIYYLTVKTNDKNIVNKKIILIK